MLCQEIRARLQDLIEDRLPDEAARAIRSHLDSCHPCHREYQDWLELWRGLSGLAPCECAPDLWPAIVPRLQGREEWPRRLVAVFVLAGLASLASLSPWIGRIRTDGRLLSACLWTIAGIIIVVSVWMAVGMGKTAIPAGGVKRESTL